MQALLYEVVLGSTLCSNWMERKGHHQKRKLGEKCQGEKRRPDKQPPTGRFVKIQTCQRQARSKDCGIIKQRCQRRRLLRDQGVDGRGRQAVSGCSYKLSLVFIGSSSSRNFRHPACLGSTCNLGVAILSMGFQEPVISAHLAAAVETTFDVVFFVEFVCRITPLGHGASTMFGFHGNFPAEECYTIVPCFSWE